MKRSSTIIQMLLDFMHLFKIRLTCDIGITTGTPLTTRTPQVHCTAI